jgi:hypothetical protein
MKHALLRLERDVQRQPCRKERSMVIGELEAVRPLDAIELRIRQARRDLTTPSLREVTRRLHAQSGIFTVDHGGTIVLRADRDEPISCRRDRLRGAPAALPRC